ncbi:MAG: DUF2189 domain-containing protein [Hyphomicrobiales bacterium]|nr:DUF2189 domain-containing protein [Hyphomicrobiales bacterium]
MAHQHSIDAVSTPLPRVRSIAPRDLMDALAKGYDDFVAMPTHALVVSVIYPVAGLLIALAAADANLLWLIFPLVTGFALIGPVAAVGLYELSRRREQGLEIGWSHAFELLQAESFRSIAALGLVLVALFALWIATAQTVYWYYFGYAVPQSMTAFLHQVLTTEAGHRMIVVGNGIGLLFALIAFSISVVAFPLLIDRRIGAAAAAATSVKAVLRNPLSMGLWAVIVAVALFLGSLPFFVGLAVVIPVLGHATWHLYRKVVIPDRPPREVEQQRPHAKRYAADFPSVLFTRWRRPRV